MSCFSYLNAKKTAETLVGTSIKYFQLKKVRISTNPIKKSELVWVFEFYHPNIIDADFDIYTSLLGKLELTNPIDLKDRLIANEKLDVNPYSGK